MYVCGVSWKEEIQTQDFQKAPWSKETRDVHGQAHRGASHFYSPFRAGLHIGCCDCNPIQNSKSDVKRHQRTPDASSAQHPPKSVLQEVQCKKSLGNSSKSYPSLEIFTFARLFKGVRSSALKTSIWRHWNLLSPPSVAHCFSRNVY